MKDKDFKARFFSLKKFAIMRGYAEEAEDFAQWVILKELEGNRATHKKDWLLTDYLRHTRGDVRCEAGRLRALSYFVSTSEDEIIQKIDSGASTDSNAGFKDENDVAVRYPYIYFSSEHAQRRAMRILDMHLDGYTLNQIGHHFGISESRVSQIMITIKKVIARHHPRD